MDDELLYEQLLQCILAPQTYMKGLIGGGEDHPEDSYLPPRGLSNELCMLAVLGGILSDDNLDNFHTESSMQRASQRDWKRAWIIRDMFADESRGRNVMSAISSGRKIAIKAFADFEKGDPRALNALIANAGSCIKLAYDEVEHDDVTLWYNSRAGVKLLENAMNSPLPKGVKLPDKNSIPDLKLFNTVDYMISEAKRIKHELGKLPKDAPKEIRSNLLLEMTAYQQIVRDIQKETYTDGIGIAEDMASDIVDLTDAQKLTEFDYSVNKLARIYHETHPSKLAAAVSDPKNIAPILQQYKNFIKASEDFKAAAESNSTYVVLPPNEKVPIFLPGDKETRERHEEFEEKWNSAKEEFRGKMLEIKEALEKPKETLTKKLDNVAKQYALANYQIFAADDIENDAKLKLNAFINSQEKFYMYNDDFNSIIEVYNDGTGFVSKPVTEFGGSLTKPSLRKNAVYANEILHVLRTHQFDIKSFKKEAVKDDPIDRGRIKGMPTSIEILDDTFAVFESAMTALSSIGETTADDLKAKSARLLNTIKEYKIYSKTRGRTGNDYMIDQAENFCKDLSLAIATADEKYEMLPKITFAESLPVQQKMNSLENARQKSSENEKSCRKLGAIIKRPVGTRQTNIRLNLKALIDMAQEEISGNELFGNDEIENEYNGYQNYLGKLNRLNDITNELYQRNGDGEFSNKITKESFETLLSAYNDCMDAADDISALPGYGDSIMPVINNKIKAMLSDDISLLMNIKPDCGLSIADAIASAETKRLDISGKAFNTVGAKSNVRYAMSFDENGKEVRGFFTREKIFGTDKQKAEISKEFDTLREDYPSYTFIFDYMSNDLFYNGITGFDSLLQRAVNYGKTSELFKTKAAENNMSIDEFASTLYNNFIDHISQDSKFDTLTLQYKSVLNAVYGSDISGRNVAMSKVANLLGMPDIIAQSVPMELNSDGKVIKGIFMENAKGKSIESIMPEDLPVNSGNPEAVRKFNANMHKHPNLIAEISKLQILDYICGNYDRHGSNIMYQFNEDNTQIIGIQGIDNDFSFGTAKHRSSAIGRSNYEVPLDNIEFIPKEIGENILYVNDDMFRAALKNTGLKKPEIDAAIERLQNVRDRINQGLIKCLTSEEMQKKDFKKLAEKESLFMHINDKTKNIVKSAVKNKEDLQAEAKKQAEANNQQVAAKKKPLHFETTQALSGIDKKSISQDVRILKNFSSMIAQSQGLIFGKGSKQFKALQDSVDSFLKQTKALRLNPEPNEKERPDVNLSDRDLLKLRANLEAITENARSYLDFKKNVKDPGDNTVIRMELARKLGNFTSARANELKLVFAKKNEIDIEEMNARLKAQAANEKAQAANKKAQAGQDNPQANNDPQL